MDGESRPDGIGFTKGRLSLICLWKNENAGGEWAPAQVENTQSTSLRLKQGDVMIFARVIGNVVSTQKDENLEGMKLMLCKEVDHAGQALDSYHVAVDAVQAGEGDFVLLSYGSAARQTDLTKNAPIDAVIMAIIDEIKMTESEEDGA